LGIEGKEQNKGGLWFTHFSDFTAPDLDGDVLCIGPVRLAELVEKYCSG